MPEPPILLLTRPAPQALAFAASLREAGTGPFRAVISPLIGIAPTGPLPPIEDGVGVILTSAQGARAYAALGGPAGPTAFCVGDATAEAARVAGLRPRVVGPDAAALVAGLLADPPPGPLLHLRGTHARGAVAERLTRAGLPTREAVIYDQPRCAPTLDAQTALSGARPVTVPLFSPRTAALFAQLPIISPLLVAAMSEAVVNSVAGLHSLDLRRAERPDLDAMLSVTAELLARASMLEAMKGRE